MTAAENLQKESCFIPARSQKTTKKINTLATSKPILYICFISVLAGLVQPQDKIAVRSSRYLSLFVVRFYINDSSEH